MLDRLSRKILKYMNKASEKPSECYYTFDDGIDRMAAALNSDSETIRADVRYLEEQGYIKYGRSQSGMVINFYLDHKGLHWEEFRREEIIKYLEEKWIDFLAMLLALAALVISLRT